MRNMIFVFGIVTMMASCTSLQKQRCQVSYAYSTGYQDATDGMVTQPGLKLGQSCADYDKYPFEQYRRDYLSGFEQRKKEICNVVYARQLGKEDADRWLVTKPSLAVLNICFDKPGLGNQIKQAYESSFESQYCSSQTFRHLAKEAAREFKPMTIPDLLGVCPVSKGSILRKVYEATYNDELKRYCVRSHVSMMAREDARAGRVLEEGKAKLERCPHGVRFSALAAYAETFSAEQDRMHHEEIRRQEETALELERLRLERQRREQELEAERLRQQREELRWRRWMPPPDDPEWSTENTSYILYAGVELIAKCRIDSNKSYGFVEVYNPTHSGIWIHRSWIIDFYDFRGGFLHRDRRYEITSLDPRESSGFTMSLPFGARSCQVSLSP